MKPPSAFAECAAKLGILQKQLKKNLGWIFTDGTAVGAGQRAALEGQKAPPTQNLQPSTGCKNRRPSWFRIRKSWRYSPGTPECPFAVVVSDLEKLLIPFSKHLQLETNCTELKMQ